MKAENIEVSLSNTRRHVFETMLKLRNQEISYDEAFATNKLASTVMHGYSIEKDLIKIAIEASLNGLSYIPEPLAVELQK